MLEKKWAECVVSGAEQRFIVRLENVVRASATAGQS
jgi:hypothetical protein